MASIHPLAHVDPKAQLADSVKVGPFCYVEGDVVIGEDCVLDSHATVKSGTTMGARCNVGQGAVLGGDPQDRKYSGESTYLVIGDDNIFREYVTIHRATGAGGTTFIGNRCFLMGCTHIGHNCRLEDDVTLANYVGVSGHVTIESLATVGGMTGIQQHVRIGKAAMIGGMSRIVQSAPPFMTTTGQDQTVRDINAVGLRRIGVTPDRRMALHRACKLLYHSNMAMRNAIELVRQEVAMTDEVVYLLNFIESQFKTVTSRSAPT